RTTRRRSEKRKAAAGARNSLPARRRRGDSRATGAAAAAAAAARRAAAGPPSRPSVRTPPPASRPTPASGSLRPSAPARRGENPRAPVAKRSRGAVMDKKTKQRRHKTLNEDELEEVQEVAPRGASFDTEEGRAAQ